MGIYNARGFTIFDFAYNYIFTIIVRSCLISCIYSFQVFIYLGRQAARTTRSLSSVLILEVVFHSLHPHITFFFILSIIYILLFNLPYHFTFFISFYRIICRGTDIYWCRFFLLHLNYLSFLGSLFYLL